MGSASFGALKVQARRLCRAARDGVGPLPRAAAATRLWARLRDLRGAVIAGYLPIGSEADPTGAMRALAADNRICVPVVVSKGAPLRFREWTPGCEVEEGAFGVPIPVDGAWRVPEVAIVPLLGWDLGGGRLGYGGGFYDRTLAARPEMRAIGLAFEAQRMEQIPREATDVALAEIVTERRVVLPLANRGAEG
ncbi:5-formyltetrahydrofolate cyclo-ligase [Jannaschia sp. Os4]|nr:5-formyltetrahydrofolate cyclo-ligase [Jannaschia sp. Os4]MBM2577266.1 5-formyltetrahydrofolate cyclo-ligase [Jannaschia sp. Os4]